METILKSTKISPEVKDIIDKLKSGELEVRCVLDEFALEPDVVRTERKLGLRKSGHRGFDVITQTFFVEEEWVHKDLSGNLVPESHKITFDSFEEYYNFLDGDIYENACYYQYAFEDEFSKNLNLDVNRLTKVKSFVTETVDDYSCILLQNEIAGYDHCEKTNKKFVKEWVNQFNACSTYEQLRNVCNTYIELFMEQGKVLMEQGKDMESFLFQNIFKKSMEFFLFQYAFNNQHNKNNLDVLMEYLSKNYFYVEVALGLCLIYTPEDILEKYNFSQASKTTNYKRKKNLKDFVCSLKNQDVKIEVKGRFDNAAHFYCENTKVYCYGNYQGRKILNQWCSVDVCRAFETFDEFIQYRGGDLRNCDLSGAIDLDIDFSKYVTDDTTKLPIRKNMKFDYKIRKQYTKGKFKVTQFWYNESGKCVKQYKHIFSYFFDFVAFLKGDLSYSDLIFCTGMKNLSNIDGINLNNAKMTSALCEQFNIPYEIYDYDKTLIREFPGVAKNEEETAFVLQTSREIVSSDNRITDFNRVSYISDLHLMQRIKNAGCKSMEDVIFILQKIIDNIVNERTQLILFGGDVSSDFSIFELFVKMLRQSVNSHYLYGRSDFIFVLGNHELWDFPEIPFEETIDKYRTVLKKNGMYLLQNDLFYMNEYDNIGIIPYDELIQSDNHAILEKLRCTRLVILGGIGFSGQNEEFNANDGIYRATIDRNTEIKESKKFEQLYDKLTDVLVKKNTIILTHMPKKAWSTDANYHDNFVYVSGHTHRNVFFDDGVKRIYADNQIGYKNENPHLKNFLMDREYDYFGDYKDGIYEIKSQEYQDFYRGKNILMTFNRQVNVLYMLKKSGYYCFICKFKKGGSLQLLNGGELKRLDVSDVGYYYDNMDAVIASIETPLKKYTDYQEKIADEIRKIGGIGQIHGCIIDIDFYNHVYVNPVDMTVHSYWASDIINKLVYPTVPALLQAQCSKLYANYLKWIEGGNPNPLMERQTQEEVALMPQEYLGTDIYKASRVIKKMQRLNSNVLTMWHGISPEKKELPYKE